MSNIGFIGLGIMGFPMANSLLRGDCEVLAYDIDQTRMKEIGALGAQPASIPEIGEKCDIVFTILPNDSVVEDVILGTSGLLPSLGEGRLVVDMSSITPALALKCATALAEKSCGHLDAPVSGGEEGAIKAALVFIVGGKQKDFDRALPYFQMMGSKATLVGENGCGSLAKLANQVIVNLGIAAVSEAFVMLVKAGGNPEAAYNAIRGGLAGSAVLDAKIPKMISRNFAPGGKISINYKDIGNALLTARQYDVPMPLTSQLMEIMQTLKVHGYHEEDHSGILHYFENLADVQVNAWNQESSR